MSVGTCKFCDLDQVVVVNGVPACQAHIDDAMEPVGAIAKLIRETLVDDA